MKPLDILDLEPNITIVYENEDLIFCNKKFLEIIGLESLEEFREKHSSLDEIFEDQEGYLSKDKYAKNWIEVLKRLYQKDRKVIIKDRKSGRNIVFYITLAEYENYKTIQLTDISKIQDNTKLLVDTVDALENATDFEIVRRLKLQQENMEKERVILQQSKLAEIGEMMEVITHQWKQPLNVISIKSQEIEMMYELGKIDSKTMESFSSSVKKQIDFMSKTIDDFRNFFNPHKNKEQFYIKKAVQDIVSIMEYSFKKHRITIDINGDDKMIYGVSNEFKQVILNLMSNSKDVFLENLKKDNTFLGKIGIEIYEKDGYVFVVYEDNGGGIKKEIIEDIFQAYFSTKKDSGGSGIGLHISKTIIEKNFNGDLSVTNTDEGARFTIKIKESE